MMRRAARVDANQAQIVSALRAAGAKVYPMHKVGEGFPDLLVTFRRETHLVELKNDKQPKNKRKLTVAQVDFHAGWDGGPLHVVKTADEALIAIGAIKS